MSNATVALQTEPVEALPPEYVGDILADTVNESPEASAVIRQLAAAVQWTPDLATAWAVGLVRSASPRSINSALLVLQNERRQAAVAS